MPYFVRFLKSQKNSDKIISSDLENIFLCKIEKKIKALNI